MCYNVIYSPTYSFHYSLNTVIVDFSCEAPSSFPCWKSCEVFVASCQGGSEEVA